jgi:hypothetical protein
LLLEFFRKLFSRAFELGSQRLSNKIKSPALAGFFAILT